MHGSLLVPTPAHPTHACHAQVPVRRPDGDVELRDAGVAFTVPPCPSCGGILKPDVTFFGDSVPQQRAQRCVAPRRAARAPHACACTVRTAAEEGAAGVGWARALHAQRRTPGMQTRPGLNRRHRPTNSEQFCTSSQGATNSSSNNTPACQPPQPPCRALQLAEECDLLLVVGSSLMVWSAFRLAKAAKQQGGALGIVNVGPTRADSLADLKLEVLAGEALLKLASHPSLLIPRVPAAAPMAAAAC